jgi:hypothetical protein
MSETGQAHTQGPWHVGALDANDQSRVVADNGWLVAVVPHGCLGSMIPEKDANARLIAAAPDFYREAGRVVEWIERLAATAENRAKDTRFPTLAEANAFDAKNYRASIHGLKAAIAKAEGR